MDDGTMAIQDALRQALAERGYPYAQLELVVPGLSEIKFAPKQHK